MSFYVLPLHLYTQRHTCSALPASAASLLCSWSISLGAVFRAWGRWEQTGGGRVAASARGPPSGAPQWPGSVFMSVFKGTALWWETERRQYIGSGTAIVSFPCALRKYTICGWWSMSTLSCFSLLYLSMACILYFVAWLLFIHCKWFILVSQLSTLKYTFAAFERLYIWGILISCIINQINR